MKFKNYIETESGIKDTGVPPAPGTVGTAGQVLSSTVTGTSWIDQGEIVAAGATRVLIACKNTSGATITKGTPVYQTGNVGATDVIEIAEADALISTGYLPAIGLLETDLINNAFGNVVITGELLNITTDPIDGVTPTVGDTIYLKPGGGLTLTKPTGEGNAIQNLGLIGKVSGGNAGSITVASIMRANDVPNLPTGRIWVGDGNTVVSDTVYLDETNERMGIGTTSPAKKLTIGGIGINNTDGLKIEDPSNTAYGAHYSYNDANSTVEIGGVTNNVLNDCISIARDATRAITINTSENVGIGTTVLTSISSSSSTLSLGSTSATTSGGIAFQANGVVKAYNYVGSGYLYNQTVAGIGQIFFGAGSERMRIHNTTGNVGIGTTLPNSKLQVDGEIDANGGDGYRINGKPWAAESSNILRLGDFDGEGFSTSIFDESSIEILKVKDKGVIINNDRNNATSYGADASLVVGGDKFSPWGPGVVTLLNNDPSSQTNDSTGTIQFAIRDDQSTAAGYTSASIRGSISFAAGGGSSGGGILDFLTSSGGLGSSPTTHMRIDRLGNVGIGTTSPLSKLHVNGGVKLGNDTAAASASKVGTFRYYTSGNNSYVDMCMQTGASTFAWVNIVTNSW